MQVGAKDDTCSSGVTKGVDDETACGAAHKKPKDPASSAEGAAGSRENNLQLSSQDEYSMDE